MTIKQSISAGERKELINNARSRLTYSSLVDIVSTKIVTDPEIKTTLEKALGSKGNKKIDGRLAATIVDSLLGFENSHVAADFYKKKEEDPRIDPETGIEWKYYTVIHEHQFGDTPYSVKSATYLTGENTEHLVEKLGIDFDPECESLNVIESASGDPVTVNDYREYALSVNGKLIRTVAIDELTMNTDVEDIPESGLQFILESIFLEEDTDILNELSGDNDLSFDPDAFTLNPKDFRFSFSDTKECLFIRHLISGNEFALDSNSVEVSAAKTLDRSISRLCYYSVQIGDTSPAFARIFFGTSAPKGATLKEPEEAEKDAIDLARYVNTKIIMRHDGCTTTPERIHI